MSGLPAGHDCSYPPVSRCVGAAAGKATLVPRRRTAAESPSERGYDGRPTAHAVRFRRAHPSSRAVQRRTLNERPVRRRRGSSACPGRRSHYAAAVEALTVLVTRGDVVEARHVVHVVAVQDGAVVLEAGDPGLVCFLRSSAKPLQALPLARARPDLTDEQLAIACSSHLARPEQLDAVQSLLAAAPAG